MRICEALLVSQFVTMSACSFVHLFVRSLVFMFVSPFLLLSTCVKLCLISVFPQNRIPIRGSPHVLVVGDPGLGKSQVI